MTRFGKKLSLSRETVRNLTPEEIASVGGGATHDGGGCVKIRPVIPGHETLASCNTQIGWGGTCNPCYTCFTQNAQDPTHEGCGEFQTYNC